MIEKFLLLLLFLAIPWLSADKREVGREDRHLKGEVSSRTGPSLLFAEAKGVAGLGKAGGDGQGGSDKAGQQVPPEVYIALTYAGTLFLFTLSVPLILYGLNKLLNKIEDCFGCGPSNRREKMMKENLEGLDNKDKLSEPRRRQQQQQQQQQQGFLVNVSDGSPLERHLERNQYLHQQQMQQQYSKNHRSHAFTSLNGSINGSSGTSNHNGNNNLLVSQQQQLQSPSPSPVQMVASQPVGHQAARLVPFDPEADCETSPRRAAALAAMGQHSDLSDHRQPQQPFIISSKNI